MNTLNIHGNHLPENGSEVVQTAEVTFGSVRLELQLSWGKGDTEIIVPLFDGAAWAGTMIWPASEALANYLITAVDLGPNDPTNICKKLKGGIVVELGCGIGLPGMVVHLLEAKKTILTDQEVPVSLTKLNLEKNKNSLSGIEAVVLDWKELSHETMGCIRAKQFLASICGSQKVDILLVADCIYEPLYGVSWRDLLGAINALDKASLQPPLILISVERRTADGVDSFINECLNIGRSVRCIWKMIYCDGKWYPPPPDSTSSRDNCSTTVVEATISCNSAGQEQHGALIEIYSI